MIEGLLAKMLQSYGFDCFFSLSFFLSIAGTFYRQNLSTAVNVIPYFLYPFIWKGNVTLFLFNGLPKKRIRPTVIYVRHKQ